MFLGFFLFVSTSGIKRKTRIMLAPAITNDFSDLLKKLQVMECSTPVAGCVVLQTEYMLYQLNVTETYRNNLGSFLLHTCQQAHTFGYRHIAIGAAKLVNEILPCF